MHAQSWFSVGWPFFFCAVAHPVMFLDWWPFLLRLDIRSWSWIGCNCFGIARPVMFFGPVGHVVCCTSRRISWTNEFSFVAAHPMVTVCLAGWSLSCGSASRPDGVLDRLVMRVAVWFFDRLAICRGIASRDGFGDNHDGSARFGGWRGHRRAWRLPGCGKKY